MLRHAFNTIDHDVHKGWYRYIYGIIFKSFMIILETKYI